MLNNILDAQDPVKFLVNVVGGVGVTDWSRTKDCEMDTFDRILSRNLRYALVSCREVASSLIEQSSPGAIVNISSIAARAIPLLAGYGAAKAGIIGFTKSLAREVGVRGVTVNAIAPGFIETDMTDSLPQDQKEALALQIPMGRLGTADEVAQTVLFLAGDGGSYITGQTLHVNGGMYTV